MRKLLAEFLGTFCLVFAGTGAVIVNELYGGAVTHPGIALTFGLVVMAMIYAFGDISGAHLNPAVSTAFALAGRLPRKELVPYVAAQIFGAISASVLHRLLFAKSVGLGATIPAGADWQSFVLEMTLTFMLMLVILAVSSGPKEKGLMAGIAIGGVVALEAMFAGPVSGASMNPARSLAPALVSGQLGSLWVYLLAPTIGAAIAVPCAYVLREDPRASDLP